MATADRAIELLYLQIEGEADLRQCRNHAPVFQWQLSDTLPGLQYDMQIHQVRTTGDSCVWSSGLLPYSENRFEYLSVAALTDGNTYAFSIQIYNKDTTRLTTRNIVFTMNTVPGIPEIILPEPPVFSEPSPSFPIHGLLDRQIPKSDLQIQLQVFTDTTGGISAANAHQITDIAANEQGIISIFNALPDNQRYFVRVRAYDGSEYSTWSGLKHFYINIRNDPPGAFNISMPVANDTLSSTTVQLLWFTPYDPDVSMGIDSLHYIVEYSVDPNFRYHTTKNPTDWKDTTLSLAALENHKRYYWRVHAVDTDGATRLSAQTSSFVINTGNQSPTKPEIIAPRNRQVLSPDRDVIWQFDDDPDRADLTSFDLFFLDYQTDNVVFHEFLSDTVLTSARFGIVNNLSIDYSNIVYYSLKRAHPRLFTDGNYYRIQLVIRDNWGAADTITGAEYSFRYDDKINTPPRAPISGFYPTKIVISTLRPVFRWHPAQDPDVNDQLKYRVQISQDSTFTDPRSIIQDSRFNQAQLLLRSALMENAIYYWRVRSLDLEELKSPWSNIQSFTVNQFNESPHGPIQLVAPPDLSELTQESSFTWLPTTDPDPGDSICYILQIDDNPRFKHPLINTTVPVTAAVRGASISSSSGTSSTISVELKSIPDNTKLQDNRLYYWRVLAVDTFNISSPAPRFPNRLVFNKVNNPPEIVRNGFSPTGGEIINSCFPVIRWNHSRDPDFADLQSSLSYQIQLSDNALFMEDSTLILSTPLSASQFRIPSSLDDNKRWFYRIRAVDSHGAFSEWSELNSFIVDGIKEPPTIIESGFIPTDSIVVNTDSPLLSWRPATDPDPGQTERDLTYQVRYFLTEKPKILYYAQSEKGVSSVQLNHLKEDQFYGYQVSASDIDNQQSGWSAVQYFGINSIDNPPRNFQLISPCFYEDSVRTNVSFQWSQSSDQDLSSSLSYSLYYGTDSLFTTNTFAISIPATDSSLVTYSPSTPLERQKKYFWRVVAIDNNRNETWASGSRDQPFVFTTVGYRKSIGQSVPTSFTLYQNYPNPFNRITTIRYDVSEYGSLDVTIYDILGKLVRVLASGPHSPGIYEVTWDGTDSSASPVPGGMYLCRMSARGFTSHKKVLLMK